MKQTRSRLRSVVLVGVVVVLALAVVAMTNPRKGYAPKQPIRFQHLRMAGKPNWVEDANGKKVNLGGHSIPCRYCHVMPYQGRHSTLPSTDMCMNCHNTVGQDKEWVLVLKQYWDRGEPIPWVKVFDLPDFVYYDHSYHLNAKNEQGKAKLDCPDCHINIAESSTTQVEMNFNMGWCIDCHRKPDMNASIDCVACHR